MIKVTDLWQDGFPYELKDANGDVIHENVIALDIEKGIIEYYDLDDEGKPTVSCRNSGEISDTTTDKSESYTTSVRGVLVTKKKLVPAPITYRSLAKRIPESQIIVGETVEKVDMGVETDRDYHYNTEVWVDDKPIDELLTEECSRIRLRLRRSKDDIEQLPLPVNATGFYYVHEEAKMTDEERENIKRAFEYECSIGKLQVMKPGITMRAPEEIEIASELERKVSKRASEIGVKVAEILEKKILGIIDKLYEEVIDLQSVVLDMVEEECQVPREVFEGRSTEKRVHREEPIDHLPCDWCSTVTWTSLNSISSNNNPEGEVVRICESCLSHSGI